MGAKQKFIKKLEDDFQIFDINISYISSALEQRFTSKNSALNKLNYLKSHLQEAFEIYKKLKLSNEKDWATLRPFAAKLFYQITKELSKLINEIHQKNESHFS